MLSRAGVGAFVPHATVESLPARIRSVADLPFLVTRARPHLCITRTSVHAARAELRYREPSMRGLSSANKNLGRRGYRCFCSAHASKQILYCIEQQTGAVIHVY